ncbi:HEPN domain-containing protein [Sandarakinorhabdus sp.]|uniref:ApeA N-terminal domain 1-containing protein n=1 Tax=Sandarakinorhabdus sp. TaxID=1916663 RepID=UPI00333F5411
MDEINSEYIGVWWLPSDPTKTVGGVLSFDPVIGYSLQLIGSFNSSSINGNVGTIFGLTKESKLFSLFNCMINGLNIGFPGFSSTNFFVGSTLFGDHIEGLDSKFIDRCSLDIFNSSKVFGVAQIPADYHDNQLNISLPAMDEISLYELDDLKFAISRYFDYKSNLNTSVQINSLSYLTIKYAKPVSLNQIINDSTSLREMCCICAANFLPIKSIQCVRNPDGDVSKRRASRYYFRSILDDFQKSESDKATAVISLNEICLLNSNAIGDWISTRERFASVMSLYFSLNSTGKKFLEDRFLSTVQALEVFSRRLNNISIDKAYYKSQRKLFQDSFPSNGDPLIAEKLRGALAYAHEPSLASRLIQIFSEIEDDIEFMKFTNNKKFLRSIVDTRNYLTHYDKNDKSEILKGDDLFYTTRCLLALLNAIILREIGLPLNNSLELMNKNEHYGFDFAYISRRYKE